MGSPNPEVGSLGREEGEGRPGEGVKEGGGSGGEGGDADGRRWWGLARTRRGILWRISFVMYEYFSDVYLLLIIVFMRCASSGHDVICGDSAPRQIIRVPPKRVATEKCPRPRTSEDRFPASSRAALPFSFSPVRTGEDSLLCF